MHNFKTASDHWPSYCEKPCMSQAVFWANAFQDDAFQVFGAVVTDNRDERLAQ